MAYDKIVDSQQLDGALTATADAIRAKTGDVSDIEWDNVTGFADKIESMQEYLMLSTQISIIVESSIFPQHIILDLPNIDNLDLEHQSNLISAKITVPLQKAIGFRLAYMPNLITAIFPNGIKPNTNATFSEDSSLISIVGEIDMSALSTNAIFRAFYRCSSLVSINLKPSSLKVSTSATFTNCTSLSDASLASIANSLDENVTGKTIQIGYANGRYQTLMGENVDGIFVIDPQGELSASDFMTNVKGWTLV